MQYNSTSMKYLSLIFTIHVVCIVSLSAQQSTIADIEQHILFLSDDKLQGRLTGSKGEMEAAKYIASDFKSIGLIPLGDDNTYLQSFTFSAGKEAGSKNYIKIGEERINYPEVYPMALSANGSIIGKAVDVGYGIAADSIAYNDYADKNVSGKIVIAQLSSPEGYHPHTKFYAYADERSKVQAAEKYGAVGIIFYNTDSNYESPENIYLIKTSAENIPAMFVSVETAKKLLNTQNPVSLNTELTEIQKTGYNVVGFIDNKSKITVVLGAHYDHLGYNEMGGSLYRGEPAIHNGADDNASGTALIMELAETLQASEYRKNNYIIIAFSGEELGLYGSKFSASSKAIEPFNINYMLNFDMVGRLDDNKNLIVNGVGTSPVFDTLDAVNKYRFVLKTTESGIGPSDHTSFYLKDIPVLHFFTGTHSDYHKPTDDAEKINYPGIELVYNYVMDLIAVFNTMGELPFEKTKEDTNENAPRFTVTLGVIPDYVYTGKGMRIDGVSDGKPAAEAGLQAGDIVIKMGTYEVVDMMSYMKALSMFKKGDTTTVDVLRNESEMEFKVIF